MNYLIENLELIMVLIIEKIIINFKKVRLKFLNKLKTNLGEQEFNIHYLKMRKYLIVNKFNKRMKFNLNNKNKKKFKKVLN